MNQNNRYFGTDGIRGQVGFFPIVQDFIFKLGCVVGQVLFRNNSCKRLVVLGKDTRISCDMLELAIERGLSCSGLSVMLVGLIPTPGVAYLTRVFHALVGIVISASHNPFSDNGIKFFSASGHKLSVSLEQAIEYELNRSVNYILPNYRSNRHDYIIDASSHYIQFCKRTVPSYLSLNNFKIVLDCANGSTYHIAPNILVELGATVVCIGCQPNGTNINQACGSTDIRQLQNMVLSEKAHLGIAYDGDGDRVIMVDHFGNKVDGDQILYIISRDRQHYSCLFGGVVGTQMSNIGLELALKSLNIPFARSDIGDRCVFYMMQRKKWYIGGESSGHIILLDKTSTGDGIIVSLQVLLAMVNSQMTLYDLCKEIYLFPQVLLNIPYLLCYKALLSSKIFQETIKEVKQELGQYGRFLIRVSGTESYIRIMIEGESYVRVLQLATKISDVLTHVF